MHQPNLNDDCLSLLHIICKKLYSNTLQRPHQKLAYRSFCACEKTLRHHTRRGQQSVFIIKKKERKPEEIYCTTQYDKIVQKHYLMACYPHMLYIMVLCRIWNAKRNSFFIQFTQLNNHHSDQYPKALPTEPPLTQQTTLHSMFGKSCTGMVTWGNKKKKIAFEPSKERKRQEKVCCQWIVDSCSWVFFRDVPYCVKQGIFQSIFSQIACSLPLSTLHSTN